MTGWPTPLSAAPAGTEDTGAAPLGAPTAQAPASASASATRLLRGLSSDGRALTLAGHDAVHGVLRTDLLSPAAVCAAAAAAGLLGRGGGRHPLAAKLRAVSMAGSARRRPVVVVNAGSTEPVVRKDTVLVERTPHLVLDGLAVAARAVGARTAVLWLHRGQSASVAALQGALDQRAAAGRPGPRVRIVQGPPRYVAGEASAVVRHLSGGPAQPRTRPPHAAQHGIDGRATLVVNAETVAHLALVVRHGPDWFRLLGPHDEPGTVLVTVAGAVAVPGVVEAAVGTSVAALLAACGGTSSLGPQPQALLVGGYAGAWVPAALAGSTSFSRAGLAAVGAEPGAGLLYVLPAGGCPAAETARLVTWLAAEGAGQCGPCLNGLPAMAGAARALAGAGAGAAAAAQRLERWAAMVAGRGACHHPDGVVRLVSSLLRGLPAEVARHAAGTPCPGTPPYGTLPLPGGVPAGGDDPWR